MTQHNLGDVPKCLTELLDRGSVTMMRGKHPITGGQILNVQLTFPSGRFVLLQGCYEHSSVVLPGEMDLLQLTLSEMVFKMREALEHGAARPEGPINPV